MNIAQRAAELFDEALALAPEARSQFVTQACDGNTELREEVRSLLAAADESEAYFDELSGRVGLTALVDQPWPALQGKRIGQWRLLHLLGRGGMGAVYLAERADGHFEKRAALKLLPLGLDDEPTRARFLVERQILARLVHDNIARLLDGGVSEDGTPFFVMDYVEGTPIDAYCEQHDLSVEARLRLVLDVARGVQFAHRNLIIHRDLKPGNVLVEESGRARLLDFGVAKVLEPAAFDDDLTRVAQRPVTPAYASPEMLRGEPVDVTTDVYSLGVIMYLLLTGRLPLSFQGMSMSEMHTHAATAIPPLVSRCTDRNLGDDIDAIVAKALAKHPTERYESIESLAHDIRNQLAGLPVAAKAPSAWYRARKFLGRHRLGVAFALSAVVGLTAFALLAGYAAVTSKRQSRSIVLERDRAEATKDFLISIFDSAGPNRSAADLTAREMLDAGRERIGNELSDQPRLQADLLATMGEVYLAVGLMPDWREVLETEREVRAGAYGSDSLEYADVLIRLSQMEDLSGNYDPSLSYASEALALSLQLQDKPGEAAARNRVGRVMHLKGDYDKADVEYRKSLAIYRRELGDDDMETAQVKLHLATLLNHRQKHQEAYDLLTEVLTTHERHVQGDSAERTDVLLAMGSALNKLKRHDEAIAVFERTFAMNERIFGPDYAYNLYIVNGLGKVSEDMGDFSAAATRYRETIRLLKLHMPDSPNLGRANSNLARAHQLDGRQDLAAPVFRHALSIFQQHLPNHWYVGDARWRLGLCLLETGDYELAEAQILQGIDILSTQWGNDHDATREATAAAVTLYEAWGKPAQADRYRQAL